MKKSSTPNFPKSTTRRRADHVVPPDQGGSGVICAQWGVVMVEQDYELLGVPRAADEVAIKAAYRRLAKECHPDRHSGEPRPGSAFQGDQRSL